MSNQNPRVSIITPSFNQARFIEQTILSVLKQGYAPIEHIVADGGSTDGTVEILRRYPHLIWWSGKDGGQADALNKGLARATGEIIGWINSDDYYADRILGEVVAQFRDPATHWVVGNLAKLYEATADLVPGRSTPVTLENLLRDPDIVQQQPSFFRRSLLERAGGWNPSFHMVMDYDLWVRLVRIAPPVMVDRQWAVFRMHEDQKTSPGNLFRQMRELLEVMRREGASRRQVWSFRAGRSVIYAKTLLKTWLIRAGLLSRKYASRPVRLGAPPIEP